MQIGINNLKHYLLIIYKKFHVTEKFLCFHKINLHDFKIDRKLLKNQLGKIDMVQLMDVIRTKTDGRKMMDGRW